MIIYIDENMPHQLAGGFNLLQKPLNINLREPIEIKSIKKKFGQGAADEDWIPEIGKQKGCVITQDINIKRLRHQRKLFMDYGLIVFFIKAPSKKGIHYWEFVKLLVKNWEEITNKAIKSKRPASYKISKNGKIVEY